MRESILSVLPGEDELTRVVVVHRQPRVGRSQMLLRQETWSQDIGWFTQNCLELSPEQVPGLRMALGCAPPSARPSRLASSGNAAEHSMPQTIRIGA